MATKAKKRHSTGWMIVLLLVVFARQGAVTYYIKSPDAGVKPGELKPALRPRMTTRPLDEPQRVTIYVPEVPKTARGEFYLVPVSRGPWHRVMRRTWRCRPFSLPRVNAAKWEG